MTRLCDCGECEECYHRQLDEIAVDALARGRRLRDAEALIRRWLTYFGEPYEHMALALESVAFLAGSSGTEAPQSTTQGKAAEDAKESAIDGATDYMGFPPSPMADRVTCEPWCGTADPLSVGLPRAIRYCCPRPQKGE